MASKNISANQKKKKKNNNNIKPCTFSYKAFGSDMFSMDAKMQTE